ncbi:family 43 glycosylhydrolase [Olivibacter domesticus]|uniref:Glycosyl hydrolases family 43 n=2 Tax=Olivibacter domesticus TaxID=407022 RepID=A0A1H7KAG9_OLID1|nr:family 43 glycosylhydrolase [Olivibacter domesticus]SEK83891.1 Glycosyl hydrolases family 43 [Olivibacter domesticus]
MTDMLTKRIKFILLILCLSYCIGCAQNQQDKGQPFSDPRAPIGDSLLTVPSTVKPLLDVWMRDTYVMLGPDGSYYLTGTTASPERKFDGQMHCWDYNDGLYLWRSPDLKHWESMGRIWSFDEDAAAWQKAGKLIKKGTTSLNGDPLDSMYRAVWAPELHYIKSKKKWLLIACLNGNQGSFVLESTSGKPEGPYRNIKGNEQHAIFDNIDLGAFEDDDGQVYLIGHNHYIARMKDDLSDVAEPFKRFKETPYSKEPYIEGVWLTKHHGKYQLLQTVWSVPTSNGQYTYLRKEKPGEQLHSYDVVVAESANIYGPYGPRYPAILEGGHNNLFQDKDGDWWSTVFFNPRGVMGKKFVQTCRPAVVPVKWERNRLKPDRKAAADFYSTINTK